MQNPNVILVTDPVRTDGQIQPEDSTLAVPLRAEAHGASGAYALATDDLAHRRTANDNIGQSRLVNIATRTLDILGSISLAILLLPVLILLLVMVTISSRGSPVFAHRRIGRGGKIFKCYKFRTMCHDAEARLETLLRDNPAMRLEWMQHHKLTNDPRVTAFGQILRKTSLDELPQLFNVLIGNMSLVGPRPVVADELDQYGRHLPSYLAMKPGLTGLWQVTCRSDSTYRRRVAIDRVYAQHKCLLLDLRILAATVPAVLSRRGAY